jgi:D-galactose 1-dehydrogenase
MKRADGRYRVKPLQIGIVGVGKIAREQHIPAILENPTFKLAAGCVSSSGPVKSAVAYPSLESMLDGCPDLDAVAICSPTQVHYDAARIALEHGKHVLLEKPPCATTAHLDDLVQLARRRDRTLFQTWHACHAAAVGPAQQLLAERVVRGGRIVWKEAVCQCHPAQRWLWEPGGFGVFDAGINALSILTRVIPEPIFVESAILYQPVNREAPVAAAVKLATNSGAGIEAEFDFRWEGAAVWDIHCKTDEGTVSLSTYGNRLVVDGKKVTVEAGKGEYHSLYRRFAELIRDGKSEVDKRPFGLLADIFLIGKQITVEPFEIGP